MDQRKLITLTVQVVVSPLEAERFKDADDFIAKLRVANLVKRQILDNNVVEYDIFP